ncbi:MAG: hypothetical protein LBS21_01140 [Clostridiales bacterium]|nr:hypothetical protein [Clostridiales bacterium]
MLAYEGYFENGHFCPIGDIIKVPGRSRALLTILDEPVLEADTANRLRAIDNFFAEIEDSAEEVPEFERVKFREVEI